ncbi:MAG TPA: M56 family metallopeptidase, partial [Planctomycetaceae bacterium]
MFDGQMWNSGFESAGAILVSAAWKSTILLAFAACLTRLFSRRSAALRHGIWTAALAGSLIIPGLDVVLPAWEVPVPHAIGALVASPPAPEKSPASPVSATIRPTGSIVAMLEGPALERTVLEHQSADAAGELPAASQAPTAAVGAQASAMRQSVFTPGWRLAVWLFGIIAMLAPLAAGILSLKRLSRKSERTADELLTKQLAEAAREVGLHRRVTLLLSEVRSIPMTWGTLWPALLLPREAQNWPAERLRIVLLHELTHVVRSDYLWQLIGALARAVYWFNPLAWWGFRRLKVELEQACDDRVLSLGTQAETYAFELLHITSQFPSSGFIPSAALAMGRSARIQRRIESILDPSRNRLPLSRRLACATAVVGLLFTAAISSLHEVKGQTAPVAQPGADNSPISSPVPQGTSQTESISDGPNSKVQDAGRQDAKRGVFVPVDVPAATGTSSLSEIRTQIL